MHNVREGVLFGIGEVFVLRGLLFPRYLQFERNLLGIKGLAGLVDNIDFSKSSIIHHFLEGMPEEALVRKDLAACRIILSPLSETSSTRSK
jgi:hypothetical protein